MFDVFGTLLDVASLETACREAVGAARSASFVAAWRERQLAYSWLRAAMGRYEDFDRVTSDALGHAAERFGVELSRAVRDRLLGAWTDLAPFPEVATSLARLARFPLAVLSNGTYPTLRAALFRAGVLDAFEEILTVDAARTYKPHPDVYRLTVPPGRGPGDVLFVTANGWDAAGAVSFGLRVAWINRVGSARERLGVDPHLEVSSLSALAAAMAGEGLAPPEGSPV